MGLSCLPCIVLVVITGLVSYWSVVAAVASCVLPLATVTYRVYTSMMLGKAVTTMHAQMCKHIQELAKSAIPAKSG